jgi:signal transduction histidine kinase
MDQAGKRPERTATDGSLEDERDKTDVELARRRATIDKAADQVVADARRDADEVLSSARETADQGGVATVAVDAARGHADAILQAERRTEDDRIDQERAELHVVLTELLRSERKETDSQLVTERERGDARETAYGSFFGMVSHDLRGMLHGISLTSALLAHDADGEDPRRVKIRERVASIQRTTARMNRLVGDLLDVAAIESGSLRILNAAGDASELLQEFDVLFRPVALASKLSLEVDVPNEPATATFDHDRLLQVLGNLASNAVKFTPAGGRIGLRLERAPGELRFAVSDTGQGIAAHNVETIFDRFWQERRDRRGVGLGLYICRCIVEAHGGKIWATSSPGAGSTFTFTLPTH